MGKYCFSDCTGGNRKEVDSSIKKCECRYLYYITSDNEYIWHTENFIRYSNTCLEGE